VGSSGIRTVTVEERPDLLDPAWAATDDLFPEYNSHGEVLERYWGRLVDERPAFQFRLVDGDEILARARSLPVRWDGALARGFAEGGANVLCAMVTMIPPRLQGRGLSARALRRCATSRAGTGARRRSRRCGRAGRSATRSSRSSATRPGGATTACSSTRGCVHERLGRTILRPEPRSMAITGTVAEWEGWTGMAFPESCDYWFPAGLAPLAVDRDADRGSYREPNVWMLHAVER
jgi:hypothetical protein